MLGTNNATQMTILPSGNVGIGTTAPDEALAVNGHISTIQSAGGPTANCGTVTGDDTAGTVLIGSGAGTNCIVAFKTNFSQPPICTVTPMNAGPEYSLGGGPYAHSDTWISYVQKYEFVFDQETNMTNGDEFMYVCIGT